MSRWFRHYAGMMRDEKLVRVALKSKQPIERVLWIWGAILESAAEIDDAGQFELDTAEAAYFLRADQADLDGIIECLRQLGRIHDGVVANWSDRQFQSDRSTDRVRAHRERKHADRARDSGENDEPGGRNDTETRLKRFRNAPETETETETETEEEKKETIVSRSVAPATRPTRSSDFDEFWKAYPRRDGSNPKAPAEKAFRAAVKAGADPPSIIAGAKRYAERDRDKIGTPYIPQAVKWLRDKRWQDYADEPAPQAAAYLIHVMQDSPEWPAWAAQWRQKRGRDPPVDKLGGWNFPAEWQSERLQAAE